MGFFPQGKSSVELRGKTAIVTGGAVRVGRALALALAGEGVNLCLHYGSSRESAEKTAAEIRGLGVKAALVQADLSRSAAAAKTIVDAASAQFGHADILLNSAAIFESGSLAETSEDSWERHFAINLKAPVFLCREFASRIAAGHRGHIISIADWRATRPQPGHLAYTLTKSGIVTMTKILAQELAPEIQVNAVAPGAILPPPGKDDAHLDRIAAQIPLKRPGSPEAIADAVRFLLRSDFVTGEVLHVTGGEEL